MKNINIGVSQYYVDVLSKQISFMILINKIKGKETISNRKNKIKKQFN